MNFFSLLSLAFAASVVAAPGADGPTHSGDGAFTTFDLGACGFTNSDTQMVVGVSTAFFNNFPGATTNTNDNPICGRNITASYEGKSVTVTIVDQCVGCAQFDLNFSPAAFNVFASESVGQIHNVTWFVVGGGE